MKLDSLWYDLDLRTGNFTRGMSGAGATGSLLAAKLRHPAVALGALGAAMALVGAKAVKMASDLEHGMAEVSTLVDTSVVNMSELQDQILETFTEAPVSNMADLTRGLYQVISAGIPAAGAMEFLNIATRAATGGVTSVATAVDGLTSAVNAWSVQGMTAKEAADSFFTAVKLGKTTFEEISSSIGRVAPIAANFNITLDDTLAALAALTLGGLGTEEAFTALRAMLTNVAKPTTKLLEQYPQLAEQFDLASLKAKGLGAFMKELATDVAGNDGAIIELFGNVRGLTGALSLLSEGGAEFDRVLAAFESKTGAADEAFNKMMESTKNLWQVLKNQFSVVMISIGEDILPLVNAELKGLVGLMALLTGQVGRIKTEAAITGLTNLNRNLRNVREEFERLQEVEDPTPEQARRMKRLAGVVEQGAEDLRKNVDRMIGRAGLGEVGRIVMFRAREMTNQELLMLQQGVAELHRQGVRGATYHLGRINEVVRERGEEFVELAKLWRETGLFTAEQADDAGANAGRAAGAAADALSDEAQEFLDSTARMLTAATSTMIDDALLALELFTTKATEFGVATTEEVQAVIENMTREIAALEVMEPIRQMTDDIRREMQRGMSEEQMDEALSGIGGAIENIQTKLAEEGLFPEGSAVRQTIQAELERLLDLRTALRTDRIVGPIEDMANDVKRTLRREMSEAEMVAAMEGVLAAQEEIRQRLEDEGMFPEGSKQWKEMKKLLEDLADLRQDISDKYLDQKDREMEADVEAHNLRVKHLEEERKAADERQQAMRQLVGDIAATANSLIRMGESLGIVDEQLAEVLQGLSDMGQGIGRMFAGDLLGGGLQALGGLVQTLGGLFGESEADKRRRIVMEKNTEAIRDLAREIGNMNLDISGKEFMAMRDLVRQFFGTMAVNRPGKKGTVTPASLAAAANEFVDSLDRMGMSVEEFQEWAGQFGITFAEVGRITVEEMQAIMDAMAQIELAQFAETFTGQMEALRAEFDLFDITDPLEQLKRFIAVITDTDFGAPAFEFLKTLDLTTAEGRQKAEELLQALFRGLQQRGGLTPEQLGGMTPQEFLETMLQVEDYLDQIAEASEAQQQSQQFVQTRTITEVSASRIIAVLTTNAIWNEATARNTAQLVEILGGTSTLPTVEPPHLGGRGVIGGDWTWTLTVNVYPSAGLDDPDRVGHEVGEAVIDAVDTALGERQREAERAVGGIVE